MPVSLDYIYSWMLQWEYSSVTYTCVIQSYDPINPRSMHGDWRGCKDELLWYYYCILWLDPLGWSWSKYLLHNLWDIIFAILTCVIRCDMKDSHIHSAQSLRHYIYQVIEQLSQDGPDKFQHWQHTSYTI